MVYSLVLVSLVAGITFAIFLTRSITQPIAILTNAAVEIGKGKLDTPIKGVTKDEIGQLAGSFSKMATDLQKTMASQEKYEDLYNNAPISYFSVGIDGIVKRCNYKAEEMTEYSAGELIGMNVIDLYFDDPDGKEKAMGLVSQFKSGQPIINEELLMKKKSGEPYWVNLTVNIIKDKDGNVIESRSVAEDITERKKIADKLRESDKRMSSILKTVGEGIIVIDQNGTITFINWEICGIFGYSEKELIGKNIQMLIPEIYRARHAAGLKRYLKDGQSKILGHRIEMEGLRKDGSIFLLELKVEETLRNKSDNRIFTGAIRDITKRKKAEKEKARLVMAIEQTAEAIFVTDIEGKIQYINPAFQQITGYSSEEAIGQNPRILKSDKQDNAYYRKMWETITQGEVWHGHFINKKKDGTLYEVDAIISPILDSSGKIFNYVSVSRDVTSEVKTKEIIAKQLKDSKKHLDILLSMMEDMDEKNKDLKLAHSELKQKQAALVQSGKLAAIGELAAGVAHEMNQPLTVIRGRTQLLLDRRDKLDEKTLKNLKTIEQSTSRMMSIINHLTTFSRKSQDSPVILDLHDTIDNAFTFVNEQLKKNNIIVKKEYSDGLPSVKGDSNQLEQIFLNLISNSRYALNEFEETRKTNDENKKGKWQKIISIKTRYEHKENRVWVEFADTGGGIPDDYLDKVFDPFFTSKGIGKGTGLGLSISYGIIKEHKGEIEAFNNETGAVFMISFPCVVDETEDRGQRAIRSNR